MLSKDARILLVDDMASLCEMLRAQLNDLGYFDVTVCHSVAEAKVDIEGASSKGIPFSLILSDINMPGEDGLSLLSWFRTITQGKVPIIMVSSMGDLDNVMEAAEKGATAFIVKPVTIERLRDKLAKL